MSDLPGCVRRAFGDNTVFEFAGDSASDRTFEHRNTAFDATVRAVPGDDRRVTFEVTVRVPMLDAVTADDVASVVEEGWFETFELRVRDVSGIFARQRDVDPEVRALHEEAVVEATIEDRDPRRGVADAAALVEFVEGTYVQGVIPGYDYEEPVAGLINRARSMAGSGE